MDRNYYTTRGLHLPFRFYTDRAYTSGASDYGRSVIIPPTEYLIFPYGEILPFQVTRIFPLVDGIANPILTAYCINGEEEDAVIIPTTSADYDVEPHIEGMSIQRIAFLGLTEGVDLPMGSYYFKFDDSLGNVYYSENVTVLDIGSDIIFRKWSNSNIDLRIVDDNILRIV